MSIFTDDFRAAPRLNGLAISDIVQISQKAAALARLGRDVIDLSIGEPDFATPPAIQAAAQLAMERGETHYTATAGSLALREAIVRKVKRDNRRHIEPSQVIVGVGAKQILANALLATVQTGDEIIIAAPYWSSYPDMVRYAGGTPVTVMCSADAEFLMSAEQLEAAITPRTRWLMLNSPSNPTGSCYSEAQLAALAEVLREHPHVGILEDAIYEHLVFDGQPYRSIVDVAPSLADRVLWVNGVSKAYAMTGWRIGYGVGPKPLIDAMIIINAVSTSHPCTIAQAAAVAALDGDQGPVEAFRQIFEFRRQFVCDGLASLDDVTIVKPHGAFYLFVDVKALLSRQSERFPTDRALVDYLLEETGVALVHGSSFGAPGHIRVSFAASDDRLRTACTRIVAALCPVARPFLVNA